MKCLTVILPLMHYRCPGKPDTCPFKVQHLKFKIIIMINFVPLVVMVFPLVPDHLPTKFDTDCSLHFLSHILNFQSLSRSLTLVMAAILSQHKLRSLFINVSSYQHFYFPISIYFYFWEIEFISSIFPSQIKID